MHDEGRSLDSCTQNVKKIYLGVSTDAIKTTSFENKLLLSPIYLFFYMPQCILLFCFNLEDRKEQVISPIQNFPL